MNTRTLFRENHRPLRQPSTLARLVRDWLLGTFIVGLLLVVLHIASLNDERERINSAIDQHTTALQQQSQARKERAGRAICRQADRLADPQWNDTGELTCVRVASNQRSAQP